MSAAQPMHSGGPSHLSKRRARVPTMEAVSAGTGSDAAKPSVPITAKLLIDDAETAALLGLCVGSIANLESRDPDFPRPVDWALERKLRRRTDVESYVERLKQRRT